MQLRTTIRRFPNETAWRDIRHYIGRLASWAKSTLFVLRAVYEERLLDPTFTVIGTKDKLVTCRTKSDSILGSPTTLTDLINRHSSSGDLNRDLLKHQIYSDIFLLRWQNVLRGQKVHAKVAMLDHFHRYRLSFARGEPYIGCSKPSCYCCNAYMSAHPLKTQERPSHGNIWVQWSAPKDSHQGRRSSTSTDSVLLSMHSRLKRQLQEYFKTGTCPLSGQLLFDSTTDLSDSLPSMELQWKAPYSQRKTLSDRRGLLDFEAYPILPQAKSSIESDTNGNISGRH